MTLCHGSIKTCDTADDKGLDAALETQTTSLEVKARKTSEHIDPPNLHLQSFTVTSHRAVTGPPAKQDYPALAGGCKQKAKSACFLVGSLLFCSAVETPRASRMKNVRCSSEGLANTDSQSSLADYCSHDEALRAVTHFKGSSAHPDAPTRQRISTNLYFLCPVPTPSLCNYSSCFLLDGRHAHTEHTIECSEPLSGGGASGLLKKEHTQNTPNQNTLISCDST